MRSAKGLKGRKGVKVRSTAAAGNESWSTPEMEHVRKQLLAYIDGASDATVRRLMAESEEKTDTTTMIGPSVPLAEEAEKPRVVPFAEVSDAIDLICNLVHDSHGDVCEPSPSDLGTYIHNNGTDEECCEGFLTLVPIARRVYERKT